jgi:hypothetical protein
MFWVFFYKKCVPQKPKGCSDVILILDTQPCINTHTYNKNMNIIDLIVMHKLFLLCHNKLSLKTCRILTTQSHFQPLIYN